jgi:hypothetical protein
MKFETFQKIISLHQEEQEKIHGIYEHGIDLINFADQYHEIISILVTEIYGESGYDWFSWFCHESDYGKKGPEAWDENEDPICYDVKSLWEYLELNKIKLNKTKI